MNSTMTVALAGNPNACKTTMFNGLTGRTGKKSTHQRNQCIADTEYHIGCIIKACQQRTAQNKIGHQDQDRCRAGMKQGDQVAQLQPLDNYRALGQKIRHRKSCKKTISAFLPNPDKPDT
ncbi:MAG: hypothetical protein GY868_21435 [Deltaproteobacteria bacterium]|nr:hypothetical protein [Deltaproteobacteria bacterium]